MRWDCTRYAIRGCFPILIMIIIVWTATFPKSTTTNSTTSRKRKWLLLLLSFFVFKSTFLMLLFFATGWIIPRIRSPVMGSRDECKFMLHQDKQWNNKERKLATYITVNTLCISPFIILAALRDLLLWMQLVIIVAEACCCAARSIGGWGNNWGLIFLEVEDSGWDSFAVLGVLGCFIPPSSFETDNEDDVGGSIIQLHPCNAKLISSAYLFS